MPEQQQRLQDESGAYIKPEAKCVIFFFLGEEEGEKEETIYCPTVTVHFHFEPLLIHCVTSRLATSFRSLRATFLLSVSLSLSLEIATKHRSTVCPTLSKLWRIINLVETRLHFDRVSPRRVSLAVLEFPGGREVSH